MMGSGAGLLALALLLGIAGGFAWGGLRPAYVGVITENDGIGVDEVASPVNVQFTGFAWFVLLALLLGVVLGAVGWRSVRRGRVGGSVWWMLWIMTVAVLGAISIYLFGDWLSLKLHPRPTHDVLETGSSFTLVPPVSPGVGWAVAPLTAGLVFWIGNLRAYAREPRGDDDSRL